MTPVEKAQYLKEIMIKHTCNLAVAIQCAIEAAEMVLSNENDWVDYTGSNNSAIKFWQQVIEELKK